MSFDINTFYNPTLSETFENSIFSEYMDQDETEVLEWAINVTQKAYDKGMVAEYIQRRKTDNTEDDKDYIDFWASIAIVHGYIVRLIRDLGLENPSQQILFKYLQQRNLFNCPQQLIADLTFITENYYSEIRKRGTNQIYKKKSDGKVVDGEAVRIFCYSALFKDEHLFFVREPYKTGWVIDRNSPLYKGVGHYLMANKSYKELTDYPTTGTTAIVDDGGIDVISISSGGRIGGTDNAFGVVFSPGTAYEVSFWVRGGGTFSFALNGYNVNDDDLSFLDINDDTDQNSFFTGVTLPRTDAYYRVKGIVYGFEQLPVSGLRLSTNLNVGRNLKSQDQHRTMIPQIICTAGQIFVYGLTITPANVDRSSTFIQSVNHTDILAINRNGSLSLQQIYDAIRYYMLPYKSVLSIKELPNLDDPSVPVIIEGEEFLLNKENEGVISGTKLMKYIA